MTEVLKWAGTGVAIWFALSVVAALFWWRISAALEKPAPKPDESNVHHIDRRGGER